MNEILSQAVPGIPVGRGLHMRAWDELSGSRMSSTVLNYVLCTTL